MKLETIILLVTIVFLALLVGCEEPVTDRGVIVEKIYSPGQIILVGGKVSWPVSESWHIRLDKGGYIQVTQPEWDSCLVDQIYPDCTTD